jgi:hypothetical protein
MARYNLSSNMAHRMEFDSMVERVLDEANEAAGHGVAADGDEVGEWELYFDINELDVDDTDEAIARIEAIWPH